MGERLHGSKNLPPGCLVRPEGAAPSRPGMEPEGGEQSRLCQVRPALSQGDLGSLAKVGSWPIFGLFLGPKWETGPQPNRRRRF